MIRQDRLPDVAVLLASMLFETGRAYSTRMKEKMKMGAPLAVVLEYHRSTKHHFNRYAKGPGFMDWATQPNPFRRYDGAPLFPLQRTFPQGSPPYDRIYSSTGVEPRPLNFQNISRLFFESLAISAWKRAGGDAWALRVNPSSGNLHPTEAYLLCGPLNGLVDTAAVFHYAPREHALELRARVPLPLWELLLAGAPAGIILLGLTSIHWRESWKYGERAYRYCALDVGHALGAVGVAAAGLGWQCALLERLAAQDLERLMGTGHAPGVEREEPDCLLALFTGGGSRSLHLDTGGEAIDRWEALDWLGKPNRLSPTNVEWSAIERVAEAARRPVEANDSDLLPPTVNVRDPLQVVQDRSLPLAQIVRTRRSAVAMNGVSTISRAAFYHILARTLPDIPPQVPFGMLPWPPLVHLAIFVHRVEGLEPGLYFLVRNGVRWNALKSAMAPGHLWARPQNCPESLDLYLLARGDFRQTSMQVSCYQEIASDGCFSLAMIAEFQEPLLQQGPWFYPRLFWECGMIGQVLYLEAEAAGLRGTGIGCFFDDGMHEILGIEGTRFQDLYHFTVGGPLEDRRIATLPAYPD